MAENIKRFVVLTPFSNAGVVACVCALRHLDMRVVPTASGTLIARELPVPKYDEWDIRNITGPDPDEEGSGDPSDDAPAVASMFSRLSPYGSILIDVNLVDDADGFDAGISGAVRARRFLGGEAGEEIPSGLLLNTLDPLVEKMVLAEEPDPEGTILTRDITPQMLEKLAGTAEIRDSSPSEEPSPSERESSSEQGSPSERESHE